MFFKSKPRAVKTILVIDDEAISLKIVAQAFTKSGYKVLIAESGEAGLKLARENHPDVIILDVVMPGMDGFMLLKELKRDENIGKVPVLVLSARQNVADTCLRLGAANFLAKPVDCDALFTQVEKLI
jgi:DNA-binding response OmpR family regulator